MVAVQIFFDYNQARINCFSKNAITHLVEGDTIQPIQRDQAAEQNALNSFTALLSALPENPSEDGIILCDTHDEETILYFLHNEISTLKQSGWKIEYSPDFPFPITLDFNNEWYSQIESSGEDWFGMELGVIINDEKINLLPVFQTIFKNLKTDAQGKLKFNLADENANVTIRLDDGRLLPLEAKRFNTIMMLLINTFNQNTNPNKQQLKLQHYQIGLLAEIEKAAGATHMRWLGNQELKSLATQIQKNTFPNVSPPNMLTATLRNYQKTGLNWLQFLRQHQLGGILADEMGLGKTLQTISHIAIEKEAGRLTKPCLIIAPTSLLYNWQDEITRFAKDLTFLVLHGNNRQALFSEISNTDIVITTYPLVVRDKEQLLQHEFYLIALDEAQYIKNSQAKMTQIILQLKAHFRLCLTGTPMENHLGELWSLFHFLMPGLLGTKKAFTQQFRTPIEKQNNQDQKQFLQQRIQPFLLRRTKNEVVKELPQKTEIIEHIDLTKSQLDAYETIRFSMDKKVNDLLKQQGFAKSQIIILDALLKLRQICCDPRLLKTTKKTYDEKHSAKLAWLREQLPQMLKQNHRPLIFSQFTSMLSLIEPLLNELGISYSKLTGQTKKRAEQINAFQQGETDVFLISLKAGGTGLNLTQADTVIHYDPWWNPAVENQASDRAHRIGQEKPVFIYKLIARDSIEDRILGLQQKKRELLEDVFSQGPSNQFRLTEKDLKALFAPIEHES